MDIKRINPYHNTFNSKIAFIESKEFETRIKYLSNKAFEVPYPWTIEAMKIGKSLYTTGLIDCISGCIISDKLAGMFHLASRTPEQAIKDKVLPFDIKNIENKLNSIFNLKNNTNLHGIIIGGLQANSKPDLYNTKCFNDLVGLFKKYNIDCSIFGPRKILHYFGKYSMLYEKNNDTLFITNNLTNQKDLNGKGKEIDFIGENLLHYYTYEEVRDENKRLLEYRRHSQLTTIPEFFKTQFYNTSLSKYDEWKQ